MEFNDIYDADRNRTGRLHRRGTRWKQGEYGLIVCVWVYDGKGKILLTRRAPEKSFAGTWENSGGGDGSLRRPGYLRGCAGDHRGQRVCQIPAQR